MKKDEVLVELKTLEEQAVNILCYTFQKTAIKNKIIKEMEVILILILDGQFLDANKRIRALSFELDNILNTLSRSERDNLNTKEKLMKTTYIRLNNELKKYCDIEITKVKKQMDSQRRKDQQHILQKIYTIIEKKENITSQSNSGLDLKEEFESLVGQFNRKLKITNTYSDTKSSKNICSKRYFELLKAMKEIDWPKTRDELMTSLYNQINKSSSRSSIGKSIAIFKKIGIIDFNTKGENLKLTKDGSKLLKLMMTKSEDALPTPG